MNFDCKPSLVTKGRIKYDPVRGADFLLLPERVVKLNKTGAAILILCDGSRTISEIHQQLKIQFSVDNVEHDIVSFLNRVINHGWVELNCG